MSRRAPPRAPDDETDAPLVPDLGGTTPPRRDDSTPGGATTADAVPTANATRTADTNRTARTDTTTDADERGRRRDPFELTLMEDSE